MAHHVAELVEDARTADPEARLEKGEACRRAILDLWEYLHVLPTGSRPFRELEPVMRAVESLDPESPIPRHYRSVMPVPTQGNESSETQKWIHAAQELDWTAKILIGFCLAEAAQEAHDKAQEWVKLAEKAGLEDHITGIVVRFIAGTTDRIQEPEMKDALIQTISDRKNRLEKFTSISNSIIAELEARLFDINKKYSK